MDEAIGLTRALLGTVCVSEAEASGALGHARRLSLDPLDYFSDWLRLSPGTITARAAQWAGVRFAERFCGTPAVAPSEPWLLEALVGKRSLRALDDGRIVLYCAPDFDTLLHLGKALAARPELREHLCFVPRAVLHEALIRHSSGQLMENAQTHLLRYWPLASAKYQMGFGVRLLLVTLLLALPIAMAVTPLSLQPFLLPAIFTVVVIPSFARLFATLWPAPRADARSILLRNQNLPIYSVLIPLRDEAKMVPMLGRAMERLDYPPEKLDIKFVVEESSAATIAAVRGLRNSRFELIIVPDASPRTKPKAMAYALPLVRGEYVVIFDAEDIPERSQLRLAASRFHDHPELDCLQAELVIENASETWLTALFAGEYAGQFGFLLPALAHWKLPLPLGGTSNHFRVRALKDVGGWDPYNVTEDADLGIRLARAGRRTGTLASYTLEEAPLTLRPWIKQRTRWMKGWMQTALVHNRAPRRFLADLGWRRFVSTNLYLANIILSPLLHSVFLGRLIWELATGQIQGDWLIDPWSAAYALTLLIGYGGAYSLVCAGLLREHRPDLLWAQLLLPLYWLLHGFATLRAMADLLWRPYFWAKTAHGRTRHDRKAGSVAATSFKAAPRRP